MKLPFCALPPLPGRCGLEGTGGTGANRDNV